MTKSPGKFPLLEIVSSALLQSCSNFFSIQYHATFTKQFKNTKTYSQKNVQSSIYISIPRTDQKALLELQTDPTQLLVVVPILMGEVDLQRMSGGAIGFLDRISQVVTAAKLKLAARQGAEETISAQTSKLSSGGQADIGLAAKAGENLGDKDISVSDSGFQYQDAGDYFGFGFDGWQSGIHEFPDFKENAISENGFMRRGFPLGKLEKLLASTLHQLEAAVTIEREEK